MNDKKKKIILAVSNDLVSDNRVHKVASTLVEANFEVCVYGRILSDSLEMPILPYKTKRIKLICNKNMLFYAELNIRFFFIFLFSNADIYTANDLDTLLGVYCAAKLRRKKIVYDSHEYFTEVPELIHNPKAKKVWTAIEKWIFPKLTHVMTVCKSIADIYSEKYNVPVQVVRNVPFSKKTEINSVQINGISKPIILYQGAVNVGRGLELMIEVMKYIDFAQFVIIGSGDILHDLQKTVKNENLEDKIFFTGRIHFSELPAYTASASLGISLEENLGKNYEFALPNKIFDYIQMNIPLIVSDLPEMKRIIEEYKCGEIVYNRNPEIIAQQIQKLIINSDQRNMYIENTKRAAKELCWDKEKEILLKVYVED